MVRLGNMYGPDATFLGVPPADLADPSLLAESRRALDELSQLLGLPNVYPFQR